MELAFDLVLHEISVEAAEATRATGAAIAWMRGGEIVCRATTGTDAPELGSRLNVESGLGAVCINTGQIQVCGNTHADMPCNQDPHRHLGARSILFAPISASGEIFGILQLFSSSRDAFPEAQNPAIQPFIISCIQARAEIQRWCEEPKHDVPQSQAAANSGVTGLSEDIEKSVSESPALKSSTHRSRPKEPSNSILLATVLIVAVALGLLIGWRKGSQQASVPSRPPRLTTTPIVIATDSPSPVRGSVRVSSTTSDAKSSPAAQRVDSADDVRSVPAGGLVISDAGEVVYRVAGSKTNSSLASSHSEPGNGLLYRLDPEYPLDAIAQRIEGSVVLDVTVRKNGSVNEVAVVTGLPLLRRSATAAVKKWRFAPNDSAGERQTRVTIKYVLPARSPDPQPR